MGRSRPSRLLLALLAACPSAWSQVPSPDLRGVYVDSNAFPIAKENAAALAAALEVRGVDGLVLVLGWGLIEPSMGQYQWDTVDQWMGTAMSLHKKVELSVRADLAPDWLFPPPPAGAGATPLRFTYAPKDGAKDCNPETIAAPWDPVFLKQWDAMLTALASHLKSAGAYDGIVLVRLTGINRNSDELHLPAQTPQSANSSCVSDSVATWLKAGYRPSLLLQGWDAITSSFQKNFLDKYFSVAIIDSSNPFPPIAEDGSVIAFTTPQSLSPSQNQPLLMLASQKLAGHLIIQNNSLYPGVPAQPETIQFVQSLNTMTAFQTNEELGPTGGAACGRQGETTPCDATTFFEMLETGIYPLGKSSSLRAQYLEVFAANVNAFPDDTLQAHNELAPPLISLVANAEGESPAIAPNTWVEIKGAALSLPGDSRTWSGTDFVNGQMPTQLDGVTVTVNGKSAYVYYISPSQIDILTPPDAMSGPVPIVVSNNGAATSSFNAQAQAVSPSFFVFNGGPFVAASHANGALLGPASLYPGSTTPAKPGETIILYGNGFGATSTPLAAGSPMQSGALSPLPDIHIGGVSAAVQFAGLNVTPGEFQFNLVVPPNLPDGDQPVTATYRGTTTQSGALLTVQR